MNDFPRWKYALVIVVLLLGVLYGLPNLFVQQPAVQITANRGAVVDQALKEKVQGELEKDKGPFERIELSPDHLLVRLAIGENELQARAQEALKNALGDQYVVALNLASTVPGWMRAIGAKEMPKGLDLQGGVHFLMEVDDKDVMEKQVQRYADDIRAVLRDKNIRYQSVGRGPKGVVVQLRSAEDRDAALSLIQSKVPDVTASNGAVVGDSYTLNANVKAEKITEVAQNTIRQNVATLGNRINALGVAEPLIQQQGESRIAVELPGVQDTAEAKKILGATATLEYRAVDENANAIEAEKSGQVPPDDKLYYRREVGPGGQRIPMLLKKKVIVSGDELVDASSAPDPQSGTPAVSVVLNAAGGRKMLDFTTQNIGKPMAVVYVEHTPEIRVVDGKEVRSTKVTEEVINSATIRGVFSNRFQTTGLESNKVASDLALLLRAGSLAAPVVIVEERVIGPSLGKDNIQKGVSAVLLGLGAVLVFMAFYYWLFGLIADIALFFNLVLLLAVMSAIGVTLTMPGIAGIVLTLGMAIDANVLVCERIREELRNGSTPLASIRAGYDKAWATILDANVTHLLAALALMTLGSGAIRGFGITLFIGILTSMFTSVTVTHAITNLVHSGRKRKGLAIGSGYARAQEHNVELFNPNSNIDFLGWRKISLAISIVLMLVSIGLVVTRGLNYALDFTGGVLVEAQYAEPVAVDQVRAALEGGGFHNAQVQSLGGTRDVSIRLQPQADQKNADKVASDVVAALKAERADVTLKRHDFVGPQVGAELKSNGIVAAVFVMIGIMIYIGIRFEKRFALAAIASEIHDTILTIGFFALTHMEFDLTVLASLLAVIGYSINDKVVVFDRVRELFRLTRKAEPYTILNRAINQTLSRTIMTSLTTALAMFALYFFGGPSVHGFALTMLVGIVIGTLSSIFFANPILYWLGVSKTDLMPVSKENPELARRP